MAKKKLSLLGIILVAIAVAGLVLAIVGILIDYFATTATVLGQSKTVYAKLFDATGDDAKLSSAQAFAILAIVFAGVSTVVAALNAFGLVKIGFLIRLIVCAATVAMAVLAFALAYSFIGQGTADAVVASTKGGLAAGGWLLPIGALMSAVPALLAK